MSKTKSKKNRIVTIFFIVFFILGMSLALYPFISDLYLEMKQENAVSDYETMIGKLSKDELDKKFAEAQEYNRKSDQTNYYNALNFGEMMCILEVEKMGIKLPVYHGTSSTVLDFALGHIETSSLPVGGNSTHCVITGHTGLTRAKIFDDLDKFQTGDKFKIHVLNRVLEYEVDQIKVVLPSVTDDLQIVRGQDYVTLVTCTPYGVNSHRLLVRGKRIGGSEASGEQVESENNHSVVDLSEYSQDNNRNVRNFVMIGIIAVIVILLLFIIIKSSKKSKRKPNTEDKNE